VLSVLTPVFGEDNVSAAVNAVLNFDRKRLVGGV
jgi:flagellar biosynthesis/type III secretory pathway M-ring protein FliF/YscJ